MVDGELINLHVCPKDEKSFWIQHFCDAWAHQVFHTQDKALTDYSKYWQS